MTFKQHFIVGARSSNLSMVQTQNTLNAIKADLNNLSFDLKPFSSAGDKDLNTTLDKSPADFFTDMLDKAVLNGEIDCAIHSAKDLPDILHNDLDWFWLPWQADPRDVIVLPKGQSFDDIPKNPRIGISSDRRKAWADATFTQWQNKNIRGTIEKRIEQLDNGDFDLLLMAGAALVRLNLQERINKWLSIQELAPPEGQGFIALTFKKGDQRFIKLRSFYTKSCCFMGSGPGDENLCTVEGINALQNCDICLHDALIAPRLLENLKDTAKAINVGKRADGIQVRQDKINQLLLDYVRRGFNVVRLKGGDPGVFARLPEETETLSNAGLAYWVIPGLSSLSAATTGTGMLLTRRGVSRGFSVITPRVAGGETKSIMQDIRSKSSLVFFMAIKKIKIVCQQLLADGHNPEESVAVVFAAGTREENILHAKIKNIAEQLNNYDGKKPGLFMVGKFTQAQYLHNTKNGALKGIKVILTCSDAIMPNAKSVVRAFGGVPLAYPLIKLQTNFSAATSFNNITQYDWIALTSPSAVRCFKQIIVANNLDLRKLPNIMVTGTKTKTELNKLGLQADLSPDDDFSSEGILKLFQNKVSGNNLNILRCISSEAPQTLSNGLQNMGHKVDDVILYNNIPIKYDHTPNGDAIFFASASAVTSFINQFGSDLLKKIITVSIGKPCTAKLQSYGIKPTLQANQATVEASIKKLAVHCLCNV